MRNAILAVLAALLAGCGGIPLKTKFAPEKMDAFDPSQGDGLVVLSTASPETCKIKAAQLRIFEGGASYSSSHPLATLPVNFHLIRSDFDDHHGNLYVLKLRPGRYYFAQYMVNVEMLKLTMYNFSVAPGEVVYLGEYSLLDPCSLAFRAQINDRMSRDIALLQSKNPNLNATKAVKGLAVASGRAVDTYKPPK